MSKKARWNFAFWQQNELALIGEEATDPAGASMRRAWFEAQGLWFDDFDGSDGSDEEMARGAYITEAFVELCVKTVQELHDSGVIEQIFARRIPVVVHELEYYDAIAAQNREANGPALASGLVNWIETM